MDGSGGGLRHSVRDDAGMTLIELVIAAAILLIAIVGLFGTLITATSMSVQAKQQNIAVNAANSYIEMVRALPYDSVGLVGATSPDPTGTLPPSTTMGVGGFSVLIAPRVTWVADPLIASTDGHDYKQVEVNVTVGGASSRPYTQQFVTYVRRSEALQDGSGGGSAKPPSINYTSGSKFLGSPPIYVQGTSEQVNVYAEVASGSSATLKNIEFRCDGVLLYGTGGQDGVNAAWVNSGGTSSTFSFTWNTTAVDASGTVLFPDGQHVLRILVWDTAGGYRYRDTPVIIDNGSPTPASSPPVLVRRDSAAISTLRWGPSTDGPTEFANHYVMHVWHETWSSTMFWHLEDFGDTENDSAALGSNPTTNTGEVRTKPLNRYWIRIEPHSYTHRAAALSDMLVPFISRPSLAATPTITTSGNGANTDWTTTTLLAWQRPNFRWSSLNWVLERSTSPTFATVDWSAAYSGDAVIAASDVYKVVNSKYPPPTFYYRLRCDVVPSGPRADGGMTRVYSNLVALTPGSGPTVTRAYDWTKDTAP